jgi:DNA-binding Xre family transcriptional regulator
MTNNIRELRVERGLSQTALAEKAGVPRLRLQRIDQNPRSAVSLDVGLKIARALDVCPEDLIVPE